MFRGCLLRSAGYGTSRRLTSQLGSRHLTTSSLARAPIDRDRSRARRNQPPRAKQNVVEPDAIYGAQYPGGFIQQSDSVLNLLDRPGLIIQRNIEFMNLFLGFEQANRYNILDLDGNFLGRIEEEDYGIMKAIMRQVYRLHRPFVTRVYDRHDNHILTIRRPFSFINSRIKAILPGIDEGIVVGETRQQWHLWRRKYNLFLSESITRTNEEATYDQFGVCNAPFLSFTFPIEDEEGKVIAQVDRNWVGLAREFLTDTGVYVLRWDSTMLDGVVAPEWIGRSLTLDERAVLLANAVSIDFDYFSRHSGRGGFFSFGDVE